VKTGTKVIFFCSPPAASHGTQMLYEAPSSESLWCWANLSAENTNFRSGERACVAAGCVSS
jgi:hypothetical protein